MVGTNVKAETLSLIDKRSAMETEMNSIISRLCVPGGPGLTNNLVDAEGFPRADIDIPAIRADRQRLAVLRSDHKEITLKIEKNIEVLHSGHMGTMLPQKRTAEGEEVAHSPSNSFARAESFNSVNNSSNSSSSTGSEANAEAMSIDDSSLGLPFAVFDEVQEGSPAALDGIRYGDQLIKFGSVVSSDNSLQRLAREGQLNEGLPVPVIVLRHGVQVRLSVTPRRWMGNGLLGCHLQPL